MKKILIAASHGGHWTQAMRLKEIFEKNDCYFISTSDGLSAQFSADRFYAVSDCSAKTPFKAVLSFLRIIHVVAATRPDAVISTGAAIGLLSLIAGKIFKAKTVWVDSIANADELSLSGKYAKRWADLWLTQWPHLAHAGGPQYLGRVI